MEKFKRVSQLESTLSPADRSLLLREEPPLRSGDPLKSREIQSGGNHFVLEAQTLQKRETISADVPLMALCREIVALGLGAGRGRWTRKRPPQWVNQYGLLAFGGPRYIPSSVHELFGHSENNR